MAWLRNNFTKLAEDSTEERRVRHTRAYILQIIVGSRTQLRIQSVGDIVPRDVSGDETRKN
ncbi:hypothetical protein PVK06_020686 [Gossypium arboreum]|uniref:Uncharacterized protein n=1 Tax=Gossypium arboreum TaxID=29729 RepID=A0ABR0PN07_GOSAR|nr:hypothetical protein PVK06_020686 [Gossypium arboreum]